MGEDLKTLLLCSYPSQILNFHLLVLSLPSHLWVCDFIPWLIVVSPHSSIVQSQTLNLVASFLPLFLSTLYLVCHLRPPALSVQSANIHV